VVGSFSPTAVFSFSGDHALGGRLESNELIREWFQRLYRIFPDLRFKPQAIVVNGFPWNTMVAARFAVSATLPNGKPYANEGMQFIRLRWGRVVQDFIYEDTEALSLALAEVAAGGRSEATAAPLGGTP
jgi:ketosteroid isomerase-like protein